MRSTPFVSVQTLIDHRGNGIPRKQSCIGFTRRRNRWERNDWVERFDVSEKWSFKSSDVSGVGGESRCVCAWLLQKEPQNEHKIDRRAKKSLILSILATITSDKSTVFAKSLTELIFTVTMTRLPEWISSLTSKSASTRLGEVRHEFYEAGTGERRVVGDERGNLIGRGTAGVW